MPLFCSVIKDRLSRSIQVIPDMIVNRPFLFLVFDAVTGLVLCGAVVAVVGRTTEE